MYAQECAMCMHYHYPKVPSSWPIFQTKEKESWACTNNQYICMDIYAYMACLKLQLPSSSLTPPMGPISQKEEKDF